MSTIDSSATVHRVQADDIQLEVTRCGHGPAVLWLHGSGPGATGMSNFGQNLEAFSDFANLVVDLPRYGGSDRPTIEDPLIFYSAEKLLALLDTLGIERASFVGNSFGGGVAAAIAATAPARVDKLVLMAPAGVQPSDLKLPDDLPPGLKLLGGYMMAGPDRERMREFVTAMLADPTKVTDELVERRYQASDREPEMDLSSGPVQMGDLRPLLGQIAAPTQLIWGREDRFVPVDWALDWVRGVSDVSLNVLSNCGHWVQFEQPDAFNRIAGDFLRGI